MRTEKSAILDRRENVRSKRSRNSNVILLLFCFLACALTSVSAQESPDADAGWPREMDSGGFHIVVYQPQVDRLKKDHLQARSAITVTRSGEWYS